MTIPEFHRLYVLFLEPRKPPITASRLHPFYRPLAGGDGRTGPEELKQGLAAQGRPQGPGRACGALETLARALARALEGLAGPWKRQKGLAAVRP